MRVVLRRLVMIFFCFAVKDRIPLINDFYHFLSNFGLDIWYDRRNIYLGDNRINTNIKDGAENRKVSYAIIFYSDNFKNGNICLEEFDILVKRYKQNEIFLFPVFLSSVPKQMEEKFKICKMLVYKEIHNQNDFLALSLHIIAKITSDEVSDLEYHFIKDIELYFLDKKSLYYSLIIEYQNIKSTNFNMRIAFLFSLYIVISHNKKTNYFHKKTMNFIYHQNCLDTLIDEKRELQIMENIIVYEFASL